ncbi:MAG: DUF1501 domain-containing protein [Pirellulales bacterium]
MVFLFQFGGPTHLETFDMKPDAPDQIRGKYNPISTNVPGVQICEKLPKMAGVMDKVTLIRGMTHTMKNHNSAAYYALTGKQPPVDDIRLRDSIELFPAYGSVVDAVKPNRADVPSFVALPHVCSDGSITPGQHGSFLGKTHDPLLVTEDPNATDFRLPELSLPAGVSPDRLAQRRELQGLIDRQLRLIDDSVEARNLDATYARAMSLLTSDRVKKAFDLTGEKAETREKYGRTTYGQSLLLARRLVEAEVKFINVYFMQASAARASPKGAGIRMGSTTPTCIRSSKSTNCR